MRKIDIRDNFLPSEFFQKIKNYLEGTEVPWFYMPVDCAVGTKNKNGFFRFCYYNNNQPDHKKYYEHIAPIWKYLKLEEVGIIQVSCNLNFRDKDCIETGFHNDVAPNIQSKTSILYINTNNGGTVFDINGEEKKVDSVENRFVTFDSSIRHKTKYQTDTYRRIIINFNYFTGV